MTTNSFTFTTKVIIGKPFFFSDDNYQFFIWKMRTYLLPFGNFVSYCLMPNHFHWQFYVRQTVVDRMKYWQHVDQVEYLRRQHKYKKQARPVERKRVRQPHLTTINLNDAIGTLLKSYSKAINKQRDWTGHVFREATKVKDGWIDEFVTLRKSNGTLDSRFRVGTGYAHHCFNYIHQNPVAAQLVKTDKEWRYSSAMDYAGLRNGTLCDLKFGKEIMENL